MLDYLSLFSLLHKLVKKFFGHQLLALLFKGSRDVGRSVLVPILPTIEQIDGVLCFA